MSDKTLPFTCEYSKSNRASCKLCREIIAKDVLRLGIMVQSPHFDGKIPNWYHFQCFWRKAKVPSEADIHGFDAVRWEDQEKIRKCLKGDTSDLTPRSDTKVEDFKIEYSKNARAKCQACEQKIAKNTIRIAAIEGKRDLWHDLQCFSGKMDNLGFRFNPANIPGFDDLKDEDKKVVQDKIKPAIKRKKEETGDSGPSTKKPKGESEEDTEKDALKKQNKMLWEIMDNLDKHVHKTDMKTILEGNKQEIPVGDQKLRERLSDCMLFGALEKCPECGGSGQLVYSTTLNTYKCTGASAWSACEYSTQSPIRKPFTIGKLFKDNEYLSKFKFQPGFKRIFPSNRPDRAAESVNGTQSQASQASSQASAKSKSSGRSFVSKVKSQKLTVKGGAAVDPNCSVAEKCHVYKNKSGELYTSMLGQADVQSGVNSYYKLQLLEHDQKKIYYVYRAWGRLGTSIGKDKLEPFASDLESAIANFEEVFLDKTGNEWEERKSFTKQPRKFYIMDIDYGEDEDHAAVTKPGSTSKLDPAIQSIIQLIFDVKQMKNTLMEFEIDLKKMPLGKLSKKQLQDAYSVLTELQELNKDPAAAGIKISDASNRFYTLIPHDFGMERPPPLDSLQLIKKKVEMIDSLLEIELAYNILKNEKDLGDKDPVDAHYDKLHTHMQVVDKSSEEFERIQEYMKNTHAKTHSSYQLELQEVIRVDREGEGDKYSKFSKLHNRQLLWHGSRVSNYAGILSQGLRIAPPEAPVTGYMFGKGVYFADMVSKSANYCYPSATNSTGLLLLCEVALGDMYERKQADPISKLPPGKHSTKGVGRSIPDPSGNYETTEGVIIPMGKQKDITIKNGALLYNEYIVYDTAQVNMKYLVKTKFVHK